jgi:hypothetical protein
MHFAVTLVTKDKVADWQRKKKKDFQKIATGFYCNKSL